MGILNLLATLMLAFCLVVDLKSESATTAFVVKGTPGKLGGVVQTGLLLRQDEGEEKVGRKGVQDEERMEARTTLLDGSAQL